MMAKYRVTSPDGVTFEVTAPDDATPEQVQAYAEQNMPKASPAQPASPKAPAGMQTMANIGGGLIRGAGSIGATLLAPVDAAARAVGIENSIIGRRDRRQAMDGGLREMGVDTDSLAYGAGKLGAEIAGTMGVGGAAANVIGRAAPAMAARAAPAIDALRTAGMSAGGVGGKAGLALRTAGGGVAGAGSAGLVNPEDAAMGGVIGAMAPGGLKMAQAVGGAAGRVLRGVEQSPELAAAVGQARQAGYVIPPTQARPTLGNRVMEGFAGKLTTAQNASAKNQGVTNRLAAQALGLAPDAQITPQVLTDLRRTAGQAYDAIGQTGTVTPPATYSAALDSIAAPFVKAGQAFPNAKPSPVLELVESLRSPSFDAAAAVEKVKQLRTAADDAFRSGNTDIARASRAASKALEDALESHLQTVGNTQALDAFRNARQLIAKTYTVEKALNPASGSIDARKLAGELKKGKPLSGPLKDAASFGLQFPKASQTVEGMGSLPQTSPLDWIPAGAMATGFGNPLMMLGVAARPAARAAALSGPVQNRLIQQPRGPVVNALQNPALEQFLLRGAPVAITSGGR